MDENLPIRKTILHAEPSLLKNRNNMTGDLKNFKSVGIA
jgi:hypothetical protein